MGWVKPEQIEREQWFRVMVVGCTLERASCSRQLPRPGTNRKQELGINTQCITESTPQIIQSNDCKLTLLSEHLRVQPNFLLVVEYLER